MHARPIASSVYLVIDLKRERDVSTVSQEKEDWECELLVADADYIYDWPGMLLLSLHAC